MKKLIILFCSLFLIVSLVHGQTSSELSKEEKGRQIIEQSLLTVDKNNASKHITTIFIKTEQIPSSDNSITKKEEFSIELPDKLKITDVSNENAKFISIWNGDKYIQDSEMYIGEKVFRLSEMKAQLTSEQKAKLKEKSDNSKTKELKEIIKNSEAQPNNHKTNFLQRMWYHVFPLLLINSFEPTAKFEFIGKAQAGEQRADVIDVKSDYYRKFRLFFDEKTHLLLMMTVRLEQSESVFEEKYFFSNYTLIDGLLIPKVIMNQNEDLTKEGKLIKKYAQNYTTIEEFKINPQFGINLFKID